MNVISAKELADATLEEEVVGYAVVSVKAREAYCVEVGECGFGSVVRTVVAYSCRSGLGGELG